jgi:hypothetical protein
MIDPRILEKFNHLPEHAQDAVSEYIEYLYDKYDSDAEDDQWELTPEGAAFLQMRLREVEEHPEQMRPWTEVKNEIYEKHGWK